MIDIHTHMLPGLDDGADSLEESLEMAYLAVKCGTEVVAVTPHCNMAGHYENFEDSGKRRHIFLQFRKALEREKLP